MGAKLPMGSTCRVSDPLSALASSTCVMQASTVLPFTLQAHEPQMAERHEYRTARVPSCSFWMRSSASRIVVFSSWSRLKSWW